MKQCGCRLQEVQLFHPLGRRPSDIYEVRNQAPLHWLIQITLEEVCATKMSSPALRQIFSLPLYAHLLLERELSDLR